MIKERRSVRKFRDEKVSRKLIKEIISISRWAPSWGNYQIARYTMVDDDETIQRLASEGVDGYLFNIKTLKEAKGVIVLSFVKGKSGKFDDHDYVTTQTSQWEIFDAGIACQTFCLAAHAKGVATCIMGLIHDESIGNIVGLPKDEKVAALIVYGYEEGEHKAPPPRKDVDDIFRYM